jgi:hypothetical protein
LMICIEFKRSTDGLPALQRLYRDRRGLVPPKMNIKNS